VQHASLEELIRAPRVGRQGDATEHAVLISLRVMQQ
jgi:hypothetical protein